MVLVAWVWVWLSGLAFTRWYIGYGPGTMKHPLEGAVKTEIKRQKRRTSQHRKRRKRGDGNTIRAWSPKNGNSRAIAFRLHAQTNHNNNNRLCYRSLVSRSEGLGRHCQQAKRFLRLYHIQNLRLSICRPSNTHPDTRDPRNPGRLAQRYPGAYRPQDFRVHLQLK